MVCLDNLSWDGGDAEVSQIRVPFVSLRSQSWPGSLGASLGRRVCSEGDDPQPASRDPQEVGDRDWTGGARKKLAYL